MNQETDEKTRQLESLTAQLESVKKLRPEARTSAPSSNAAKIAIDFASAVAVGSLLGYGFDEWQHTLPWGLLVGMVVGTAAGIKLMFEGQKRAEERELKE